MRSYTIVSLSVIVLAMFSSCTEEENTVIPKNDTPSGFWGTILDNDGNPADSAEIHFLFRLSGGVPQNRAATMIQFSVPSLSLVTVQTLRWHLRTPVQTIVHDTLPEGSYSYPLTAQKHTNGLYHLLFTAGSFTQEKSILINDTSSASLVTREPFSRTASDGTFFIPFARFGFGYPIILVSESGGSILGIDTVSITQHLQVIIQKQGHPVFFTSVTIDTNASAQHTFRLK